MLFHNYIIPPLSAHTHIHIAHPTHTHTHPAHAHTHTHTQKELHEQNSRLKDIMKNGAKQEVQKTAADSKEVMQVQKKKSCKYNTLLIWFSLFVTLYIGQIYLRSALLTLEVKIYMASWILVACVR